MSYPLFHTINKERKRAKKKERTTATTIFSLQKPDILTLPAIGHSYFALTSLNTF
jgi:hypothetical protein